MTVLNIARMGAPSLRQPALPVADPTAPEIARLVADMFDTMLDAGGVGLAATQVRVPLRVVIFQLPADRVAAEDGETDDIAEGDEAEEEPSDRRALPLHVLINPVIVPQGDDKVLGWEGCLSVPGMRGMVPRFRRIRYEAVALDGKPISREVEGFHARVVQHECDHLDGVLYPMRMTDLGTFGFDEEFIAAESVAKQESGSAAAAFDDERAGA